GLDAFASGHIKNKCFPLSCLPRDRAEWLELALRSLMRQSLPASAFEIVVVDNGSHGRTPAVVAEVESTFARIQYISDASPGLHEHRTADTRHLPRSWRTPG